MLRVIINCFDHVTWPYEAASLIVYKIPYRRARAWPSASREQMYHAYNTNGGGSELKADTCGRGSSGPFCNIFIIIWGKRFSLYARFLCSHSAAHSAASPSARANIGYLVYNDLAETHQTFLI